MPNRGTKVENGVERSRLTDANGRNFRPVKLKQDVQSAHPVSERVDDCF